MKEVIRMAKETPEEKAAREAKESDEAKAAQEAEQARFLKEEADRTAVAEAELEAKRLADAERNKVDTVSIKGVVLKGNEAQRKGTHSIHLTPTRIVNFVDGKADVRADDERLLKSQGYIE
jgi:hemolysin activation/secretion protein